MPKKLQLLVPLVGAQGERGLPGDNGATFTPAISDDGVLSWTNDRGLANPDPFTLGGLSGSGVHVGPEPPTDANVDIWVDTDEESPELPSGNTEDCIKVPDTAKVGQTIVVKAVDENGKPTEWEAADFPSGSSETWEVINEIITTEEIQKISIDVDSDGNAFRLSEAVVEVSIVSTESNASDAALQIRVNADSNSYGATNTAANRMFRGSGGPFECAYRLHARGDWTMGELYNPGNDTSGIKGYFNRTAPDNIVSFYFSGGTFGVGSRIAVKGVRK